MVKKLTKGQKAWQTRRANLAKANQLPIPVTHSLKVGDKVTIKLPENFRITDGPAGLPEGLTPYEQLDNAITDLENRILNTVARIKSLGI